MNAKTTGIVLHKLKYNDNSIIVKILTESNGIVSFMIRISKSSKKTPFQLLQPGNILLLDTAINQSKSIQKIKEFSLETPYTSIPYDLTKSTQLLFLCELILKTVHEIDIDQFYFIKTAFLNFDKSENKNFNFNFYILFLVYFTSYLGFQPDNKYTKNQVFDFQKGLFVTQKQPDYVDVMSAAVLSKILGTKFDTTNGLDIDKMTRKQVFQLMMKYYRFHVEGMGIIKSMEVLNAIAN